MRFFIDGRIDIRPLSIQDKAHEPLPYDYTSIVVQNVEEITDGDDETIVKTQADWGTGLDFYVTNIFILLDVPNNGYLDAWEGFAFDIYEDDGATYPGVLAKTLTPINYPAARFSETGNGELYYNFRTEKNKVNAASSLVVVFENYCGVTITIGRLFMTISGVII